jgi:PAS domain S-box-containing protein
VTAAIGLGCMLLAILAAGFAAGCWTRRERTARALAELQTRLDRIAGPSDGRADPVTRLAAGLEEIDRLLQAERARSAEEVFRRAQAEERWRESEQRYALAIRGANDGLWEWDMRTGGVYYSPRWKSLLGYSEQQLSADPAAWTSRIHPDDRSRVLAELDRHLAGDSERFESEHRLRHHDGTWRWVLARACAVRHANGKPIRLVGLMTDISARKRTQELLLELADGLSQVQGEDCLRRLVRAFSQALGVSEAFVCECCDTPPTRVRMLARWKRGDYASCVEFDLEGTACEDVIRTGSTLFQARGLGERWPLERQFERESYLGLPCLDSEGRVIGHVACADPEPMADELPHQALLKLFAVRASMELERRRLERERGALGMRSFGPSMRLH